MYETSLAVIGLNGNVFIIISDWCNSVILGLEHNRNGIKLYVLCLYNNT